MLCLASGFGDDVHVLAERLDAAVVALSPRPHFDEVEEDLPEHQTLETDDKRVDVE